LFTAVVYVCPQIRRKGPGPHRQRQQSREVRRRRLKRPLPGPHMTAQEEHGGFNARLLAPMRAGSAQIALVIALRTRGRNAIIRASGFYWLKCAKWTSDDLCRQPFYRCLQVAFGQVGRNHRPLRICHLGPIPLGSPLLHGLHPPWRGSYGCSPLCAFLRMRPRPTQSSTSSALVRPRAWNAVGRPRAWHALRRPSA